MMKRALIILTSICLFLCMCVQDPVQEVRAAGVVSTAVEGLVLDDPEDYSSKDAYVEASIEKILEFLDVWDCPDWLKVLRVHDFVCEFITYDIGFHQADMYEVLVSGRGVCSDYAAFTQRLLVRLGVNCGYIVCFALDHAWNIVEVQGKWYNLDVTLDDRDHADDPGYQYFLKSDKNFGHGRGVLGEEEYIGQTYSPYQNGYAGTMISETDFYCGNFGDDLYWAILEDDTLNVYGSGDTISLGCQERAGIGCAVIPEGITTIGRQYADGYVGLGGCDAMTAVYLPTSLTFIGTDSFAGCYGLTDVYYAGSREQWDAIEILSGNEDLLHARIHFAVSSEEWETRWGICGDDLTWTLAEDHVLRITGTGDMYDYGPGEAPWHAYASHIFELKLDEGVTGIGSYAFDDCALLADPEIPAGVARFGDYAFSDCTGLRSFTIPDSVSHVGEGAFYGCARLRNVKLTGNITCLPDKMFYGCERLWQVEIPEGISAIGDYCFYGCTCFSAKSLPEGLTAIGEYAFAYCTVMDRIVTAPNVTEIAAGTFYGCSNISVVDIPEYITSIGAYAFAECDSLYTLRFHGTPLRIGDHAFHGCGYMENLDLAGVTAIGDGSFYGCYGLETVTIPDTVTAVGAEAFMKCGGLGSVVIPGGVENLGASAFADCYELESVTLENGVESVGERAFANCAGLKEIILPDSLEHIGSGAFNNCRSLARITLPNGLRELGSGMFSGCPIEHITIPGSIRHVSAGILANCSTLKTVVLEEGIVSIGENAFGSCWNLSGIEMPDSLTRIERSAFSSCSAMTSISIPGGVTFIGDYAFQGCGVRDVYYGGNEPLWGRMEIGRYNDALKKAEIHPAEILPGHEGVCNMAGSVSWLLTTEGKLVMYGEGEADDGGWTEFRDEITSITIQPGVTAVNGGIFGYLSNLTAVHIPDTVTALGGFSGCSSLTRIEIPDSVQTLASYAFSGCSSLKDIRLPAGLTSIPDGMFSGCTALEELVVPEQVTDIGSFAFDGCTGLKDIRLSAGLTSIKEGTFFNCSSLRGIALPSGIVTIEDLAFYGCAAMTGIEFPEHVTEIGADVFSHRDNLTRVIFPGALTGIGEGSFGMNSLREVYFTGSEEQWSRISIASDNDGLRYAQIHYHSGQHLEEKREENHVSAACGTDGGYDIVSYCTVCEEELRREHIVLPASGHDYAAAVTAPTCLTGGCTTYTCTVCADTWVGAYTQARGHSYEALYTMDPCCDWNGYTAYRCSACGDEHLFDYILGGHQYESVYQEPTCQKRGYTGLKCTCGMFCDWEELGGPVDHVYVDGHCKWCEKPEREENPAPEVLYGDANGDGRINSLDVILLRQYLADWDVTLDTAAADANGDGRINSLDVILLRQYLADWDVTLGPKS